MSESDTIFNERDRSCAAVQLMLSTNPSYDNRTIASTLKMQIWIATNNRDVPMVMKTKFPATVMVFGVVSSEGHIIPPHIFKVGLKVNTKVYLDVQKSVVIPWCNQEADGRPWVWQQDSALAQKSKETQAWLQKECYDLNLLDYFDGHMSRTSPTWPPTTPKPAWLPPSTEYSPSSRRRLWKRHAPNSRSVSRQWLRLKAATLNRCQLYYIIKLPELIFSIKVLKYKAVVLFSLGRQFYRSPLYILYCIIYIVLYILSYKHTNSMNTLDSLSPSILNSMDTLNSFSPSILNSIDTLDSLSPSIFNRR